MKLSHVARAYNLAMERRQAAMSLHEMESEGAADAVEVTVSGWQVDISVEVAETISADAIAVARETLAEIYEQLVALGVVIDIAPQDYETRNHRDGCGDPMCAVCSPLDDEDGGEVDDDDELEEAA